MEPKTSDPAHGRRSDHRIEAKLKAVVQVPTDEDGGVYLKGTATVENVSPVGICVRIEDLNEAHSAILAESGRSCSVICEIADTEESVFLSGKIAWVEIKTEGPQCSARFGLHLTDTPSREHRRLLRFIDRLTEKSRAKGDAEEK